VTVEYELEKFCSTGICLRFVSVLRTGIYGDAEIESIRCGRDAVAISNNWLDIEFVPGVVHIGLS
jgi:hypothetical protein